MVKRNTTLYLEDNLIRMAKSRELNISDEVNEFLKTRLEFDAPDGETEIIRLKDEKMKEIERLKAELFSLDQKLDEIKREEDSHVLKTFRFD